MASPSSAAVTVRFAPSPTGYLHIGGARTALFNWLFARRQGGRFLLRIEDTDVARSSPEMTDNILASLKWLGLDWDGEPVLQSANRPEHVRLCRDLLDRGLAYPCFCDPEEQRRRREEGPQAGTVYKYERTCLSIPRDEAEARVKAGEPHAVRFRIPDGRTTVADRIRGDVTVEHAELDDFVILRSDGTPVYQVSVVADDHAMAITHVIRGDDHLSNTPKQILLYRAMNWPVPEFAHVPMILGPDKKRLSKRHGATSVGEYERQGVRPEALRNFLALLGWSPGDDREIMTLAEMTEAFSLESVSKKSAVFDETKLAWMNGQYLSRLSDEEWLKAAEPFLPAGALDAGRPRGWVPLMRPRVQKLSELTAAAAFFFNDPEAYEPAAVAKHWPGPQAADTLDAVRDCLNGADWNAAALEAAVRRLAEQRGVKAGALIHPVRIALTGSGSSPGLFEVMETLGAETVFRRMEKAAAWIRSGGCGVT
ncbi:MAG: glutamate--tRNA ligase [bacterium]|nr:glutamate--tRNA ligase [bacterium]